MKTPDEIRARKTRGPKIAALTAYDYPTARLLDEGGMDIILVGDSLGMVVLGYADTTPVTMEDMVHHTRAVARGVENALVVTDLPARSYETPDKALANARRLIEAGARAVKLEGGAEEHAQVAALTAAGISVMGHIGMLPQHIHCEGGYRVKGRSEEGLRALINDGLMLTQAGAFAVVLELLVPATARAVTSVLPIPTIGIGSGLDCDGQILVTHDLIGLFPWFRPKFATAEADVAGVIREAVASFVHKTTAPGQG